MRHGDEGKHDEKVAQGGEMKQGKCSVQQLATASLRLPPQGSIPGDYAKAFSHGFELSRRESFRHHINEVLGSRNVSQLQPFLFYPVSDCMVTNVNVPRTSVIHLILSQENGSLIVS